MIYIESKCFFKQFSYRADGRDLLDDLAKIHKPVSEMMYGLLGVDKMGQKGETLKDIFSRKLVKGVEDKWKIFVKPFRVREILGKYIETDVEKEGIEIEPYEKKEGRVVFDAEVDGWFCIKKMTITEEMNPIEAAYIFGSIHYSIDQKIAQILKQMPGADALLERARQITDAKYNEKKKKWKAKINLEKLENLIGFLKGVEYPLRVWVLREALKDGGIYLDPEFENPKKIGKAFEKLLSDINI